MIHNPKYKYNYRRQIPFPYCIVSNSVIRVRLHSTLRFIRVGHQLHFECAMRKMANFWPGSNIIVVV